MHIDRLNVGGVSHAAICESGFPGMRDPFSRVILGVDAGSEQELLSL